MSRETLHSLDTNTGPIFKGDPVTAENYVGTLAKALSVPPREGTSPLQFSENPREFFPAGESKRYAEIFNAAFYDPRNEALPAALKQYTEQRKILIENLGKKVKGTGNPCILFTPIQVNTQESGIQTLCLVAISGVQSYSEEDIRNIENPDDRAIAINKQRFWNTINEFLMVLSRENTNGFQYVLLGNRSENYDILLRSIVLAKLNSDESTTKVTVDLNDPHKGCAEKATFNFLQKLIAEFGSAIAVMGSGAFSLRPSHMNEIDACSVCQTNIPAVQTLLDIALALSPTREGNQTPPSTPRKTQVKPSPFKTTPEKENDRRLLGLFHMTPGAALKFDRAPAEAKVAAPLSKKQQRAKEKDKGTRYPGASASGIFKTPVTAAEDKPTLGIPSSTAEFGFDGLF